MESRIKYLENKIAEADSDKRMLGEENKQLKTSYSDLLKRFEAYISKGLNPKIIFNKKEKRD